MIKFHANHLRLEITSFFHLNSTKPIESLNHQHLTKANKFPCYIHSHKHSEVFPIIFLEKKGKHKLKIHFEPEMRMFHVEVSTSKCARVRQVNLSAVFVMCPLSLMHIVLVKFIETSEA